MQDESSRLMFRTGQGDWEACAIDLDRIRAAAEGWRRQLAGVERPWLCWNVDPDWCLVQQRLVRAVGWTPVVGFDPRVGAPARVDPAAVLVDFNAELDLPTMYPHFPLEFTFLFAPRLAFWHSDLLVRIEKMRRIADLFAALQDGETAAVPERRLRHLLTPHKTRYWELIGCTTRGASQSQFEHGCGWWMNFWFHPNHPERGSPRLSKYNWDHGSGVMYWHRHCNGKVRDLSLVELEEGHFSQIGKTDYKRVSPTHYMRNMGAELSLNYELAACTRKLDLEWLLSADPASAAA